MNGFIICVLHQKDGEREASVSLYSHSIFSSSEKADKYIKNTVGEYPRHINEKELSIGIFNLVEKVYEGTKKEI